MSSNGVYASEPPQVSERSPTQATPELVAVHLSRARHEIAVGQLRLYALEQNVAGVKQAIQVWTDRVKILEEMMPGGWSNAIESQLHVPPVEGMAAP